MPLSEISEEDAKYLQEKAWEIQQRYSRLITATDTKAVRRRR